jgi:hypothetical protein
MWRSRLMWLLIWPLMALLAFLLPAVSGLAVIYQWTASTRTALASRQWRATEGRVIEAYYKRTEAADESIHIDYHAEYEYVVNGRRYRCARLTVEPRRDIELRELSRAGLRLSPGSAVRVYYNPANPAEALLVRGRRPHWSSIVLGIVMLAIPVGLAWRLWPSRSDEAGSLPALASSGQEPGQSK